MTYDDHDELPTIADHLRSQTPQGVARRCLALALCAALCLLAAGWAAGVIFARQMFGG